MTPGQLGRRALLLLALTVAPAWAAERASLDKLKEMETELGTIQSNVEEIHRNFTERSGLIGVSEARQRYEDAVYLYLIGDYEPAATSFYILVESRALGNAELARESEWYLGECLFEMENYRTAAESFERILQAGPSHPYFADAVRRSLEIYALVGDVPRFDSIYNKYILTNIVPPTDNITYTLARSFHRRGEAARARALFESVPQGSAFYSRARFYMGVLDIEEKDLSGALVAFQQAEAAPVDSSEEKVIQDQSRMAIARIYYELQDWGHAVEWYQKLEKDSSIWADKLYESVWVYIRQEQWGEALRQVDIFLMAFPDHRYTARLKLLRGQLQMKSAEYEGARTAFEAVLTEYEPVVARLDQIQEDPTWARQVLGKMGTTNLTANTTGLPATALEMLVSDPEVGRASAAWRSLQDQRQDLAEAQDVVRELETALTDNPDALSAFVSASARLDASQGALLSMRSRLLEAENLYIRQNIPAASRKQLEILQEKREAAMARAAQLGGQRVAMDDRMQVYNLQVQEVQGRAARLSQVVQDSIALADSTLEAINSGQTRLKPEEAAQVRKELEARKLELVALAKDLEELQSEAVRRRVMRTVEGPEASGGDATSRAAVLAELDVIRQAQNGLRRQVVAADAGAFFAQVDRMWAQVDTAEKETDTTVGVLATARSREADMVRTRLAAQRQQVERLVAAVNTESTNTEALALTILRRGMRDVEGQFTTYVVDADTGIIDVYWQRKLVTTEQIGQLREEQAALLEELDARFGAIQQQLEE